MTKRGWTTTTTTTRMTTSSPAFHISDSISTTRATYPKPHHPSTRTSACLVWAQPIRALHLGDSAWYLQSLRYCRWTTPRASPCHARSPLEARVSWSWGRRNTSDRRLGRPNRRDAARRIYLSCCDSGHRPSKPSFVEGLSHQSPRPWKRIKYADMPEAVIAV